MLPQLQIGFKAQLAFSFIVFSEHEFYPSLLVPQRGRWLLPRHTVGLDAHSK